MNGHCRSNASQNSRSHSPAAFSSPSSSTSLHTVFTLAILIVALLCWTSTDGASAQLDSRLGSLPAFREFDAPPLLYQSNDGENSPLEEATTVKRMRKRPFRLPAQLFFGYRPMATFNADGDSEEGGGAPSKRGKHQQKTLRALSNEMNASGGGTQRRMRSRLLCMMALASPVACRDI